MQVHTYTNQPADMHRVLDRGVDGVITTYPDVLETCSGNGAAQPTPPDNLETNSRATARRSSPRSSRNPFQAALRRPPVR